MAAAPRGRPGLRPAFVDEQGRYDWVARAIDAYRERYGVDGEDPLGPRPFETFPRLAYDEVAAADPGLRKGALARVGPTVLPPSTNVVTGRRWQSATPRSAARERRDRSGTTRDSSCEAPPPKFPVVHRSLPEGTPGRALVGLLRR